MDFPVPLGSLDEEPADRRLDGVEQKRRLQALLLDDRGEGVVDQVRTRRLPKVGSACVIGGNFHVPISGTAVSRLTLTSTT